MKCVDFAPLIQSMKTNNVDKEHYSFNYNKFKFDVIFPLSHNGYQILVAIHNQNWGCVLNMNKYFIVEMNNEDYYSLCKILNLSWSKDHFNSSTFLRLLSEKAPRKSSLQGVDYRELRKYSSFRHVDENEKIYFCGWNDHLKDKRQARNFDKTEFYLGKTVADYCRRNNISSLWSSFPRDERSVTNPWDI